MKKQSHAALRHRQNVMRQRLTTSALLLLATLLLAYPLDWAIWRMRMAQGHGMGEADVTETTAATLKGNHFEVYAQQSTTVSCSRSLLPQAGAGACWWIQRHPQVIHQY